MGKSGFEGAMARGFKQMKDETNHPHYEAFLLRVWRKPAADAAVLFELEHVKTKVKQRFSSLEDLNRFLNVNSNDDENLEN